MRVLDLFSGIGGFALGLESVGFTTVGFCELEGFPRAVLAKHWPHVPIHDDVRTLSAKSVPWLRAEAARGIDLICGGFPCQDISVAGKGAGIEGHRSGLWREFARLVEELRPRWVLAENVGALKQRGIDRVCADLEGHGYAVWPLLVGAGVGVGAPHRRDRIWIVAHRDCDGHDGNRRHASAKSHSHEPQDGVPRSRSRADCASELSNSDAGRRGREGDPVQAGRDEPERSDSAVGLADRNCQLLTDGGGRGADTGSGASGGTGPGELGVYRYADGRGERPVGEPTGAGLEGQRADAGQPQEPESRDAGMADTAGSGRRTAWGAADGDTAGAGPWLHLAGPARWPARPGEPQYEWEEPRLAYGIRSYDGGLFREGELREPSQASGGSCRKRDAETCGRDDRLPRSPELPLGGAVDGLSLRLARRANRESLKALGNSVVPQVVALIGQAILEADRGQR